jgi:drug/metabolite transporter (DMT)-like permease
VYASSVVERAIRSQSNSAALTSHAAIEAIVALFVGLLGLSLSGGALFVSRAPLMFFTVILISAILFVITTALLSRWFRKYGRRRSRHGNLARGQVAALFTFLVLLLQAGSFLGLFLASTLRWRGF